ncbi:hypothetical protein [Mycobacteroides abscessus]|nr:hypothetical protein [Mycobacteroides abscessus]DAZ90375.1 TPA_asm: hypothetical protein PROPHIFSQJ01-1_89 [Mycobacterium phage prophiFSQJ01-1]SII41916.1 Uncharacterised protein [Mycobacteroides abscessus subsp. abscessus]SIK13144.1 Uncharacterised protein [Mycobacteroides abscessus subsp. abscessus]SIN25984.1 Uncharacterised protein [Mycobacteroides abscessus subsp. abscessus]SLI50966.1 Uncharacterised protein [Mycobacteroides abscessus subsp. abscessus]
MSGNERRCSHGHVCEYVHRKIYINGEYYVTGGDYWHSDEERCSD